MSTEIQELAEFIQTVASQYDGGMIPESEVGGLIAQLADLGEVDTTQARQAFENSGMVAKASVEGTPFPNEKPAGRDLPAGEPQENAPDAPDVQEEGEKSMTKQPLTPWLETVHGIANEIGGDANAVLARVKKLPDFKNKDKPAVYNAFSTLRRKGYTIPDAGPQRRADDKSPRKQRTPAGANVETVAGQAVPAAAVRTLSISDAIRQLDDQIAMLEDPKKRQERISKLKADRDKLVAAQDVMSQL